jgi:hypothetical protein
MSDYVHDVITEAAALGVKLRLDGRKIQAAVPRGQMARFRPTVERLRANREELRRVLQQQTTLPNMPAGVRLIEWNLKQPPVLIESNGIVIDPNLFGRRTLEDLGRALSNDAWVGWSVPQLVDRLRQVGIVVELNCEETC